jgi:large subunit ribosomal protein L28
MSGKHKITSKKPQFGNHRSFSMRATRRKFLPNLQNKRFYVPEIDAWVSVRVSVAELRTIDKIGMIEFCNRRGIAIKSLVEES